MLKRIFFLFVLAIAASPFLFAQITTSSISGTVKNEKGEPLDGATITAVHTPTGTRYATTTRANGSFSIQDMRPGGPYSIEITHVGFDPQKYDDVYLRLAETYLLNSMVITKGAVLTNVTVAVAGRKNPIFNSSRTGAVTNLSRVQIERLPTISRSVNDLTRTTPQSNGSSIAGGNYRQNNFTIDGADFNNSFGIGTNLPAGGSPISLDALEEISVNISPFDVRQSGFIGSAINAITRSGTNNFSGSLYEFWRNQNQQGDQVEKTHFVRTPFSFKQYGVRLGGPVVKNKLFFFFNYETDNQPKFVQTRVASTSTAPFGSSPNIARPTRDSLDYISQYLLKNYGYVTGAYDGYSTIITHKKWLGRIDWNIAKNEHFTVRYSQVEGGEPNPPSTSTSGSNFAGYPSGQGRNDINTLWYQNSNYFQGANFYSLAAELTSKFGKKFSNVLRGTYTYQNDSRNTTSSIFPFVDILSGGTPYTSFGDELFSFGNLRKVKMYSFVDNLSVNLGKHIITGGVQADWSQTINGFQRFGTSFYIFNSWNDFASGAKPANLALTFSFLPGFRQAFPSFQFAQYSGYAQDEMTLTDNFRLTVGVRLDQPKYLQVDEIKTNPYILAVNFADGAKINTGILPKTRIMASPRIGFNWDINGDRSLQIRGGTGIFTGKIPFVWIVSQSGDNGMLQTTIGISGQANTPGPFNPDPAAYRPTVFPTPGSIIPTTIEALDPNYKFPQTWKTSLGIDKKLPGNAVLTVEAIFNKDMQTSIFNNVNLVAPQPLNVAGYPDNRLIYPNPTNLKFINPVLTTPGAITSVVFVPNGTNATAPSSINGANVVSMTNGNKGFYFSISAQVQKQFTGGFTAFLDYTKTVAANLFDGSGDQPLSAWQATATSIGPNVPKLAQAGYVVPGRLSGGLTFRKEFLKHLGTTISVFYDGESGGYYSYTYSGDFNRDGVSGNDLIYIPKNPSEITFTSFTYPNGVTYTPQQQSDIFFKYIAQDKYLSKHMGQFAERNGAKLPWHNEVDARFSQDLFTSIGKHRNTIQFSIDMFNLGNFLYAGWGTYKSINASALLVPTNATTGTIFTPGGTIVPTFRLQTDRNHPVTETYRDNVSISSTYYAQFGLRYIFGN